MDMFPSRENIAAVRFGLLLHWLNHTPSILSRGFSRFNEEMYNVFPLAKPFSAPEERLDFKFGSRKVWADVPFFLFPLAVKTSMESTKDHTCCDCHLPLSVTLLHCNPLQHSASL